MSNTWVNGKHVDYLQAAYVRHKVSPGCRALEQRQERQEKRKQEKNNNKASSDEKRNEVEGRDPCQGVDCHRGKCLPAPGSKRGYTCKCVPGYKGRHCTLRGKRKSSTFHAAAGFFFMAEITPWRNM